jgi:hypothetical protein
MGAKSGTQQVRTRAQAAHALTARNIHRVVPHPPGLQSAPDQAPSRSAVHAQAEHLQLLPAEALQRLTGPLQGSSQEDWPLVHL